MQRESAEARPIPKWLTSPEELARHVDTLRHSSQQGADSTEQQLLASLSVAQEFGVASAEVALRRTLLIFYRDSHRLFEAVD